MFLLLVWFTIITIALGMFYTYKRSGDVFHPAMMILPMFGFIYAWMPLKLASAESLSGFFYPEQLWFVQAINALGVLAFILGSASVKPLLLESDQNDGRLTEQRERRLLVAATLTGLLGLTAWTISVQNVGGVVEAFSHPYSGGWDDSGYIRDGSLLMFSGVILAFPVLVRGRRRWSALVLVAVFTLPWAFQALFTSRRGPSFMICAVLGLSWFLNRRTRLPIGAVFLGGLFFGYAILLLVVNRNQIYWGSDFELKGNVDSYVQVKDGSNEYVYGAGSILDSYYTGRHFWGRRYLAQVVIRPIPSAIWPNKYEDFGLSELLKNAGNSTTFVTTLGWAVPPGAAPGIIADLWVEFSWLAIPALWIAGRLISLVWLRAVSRGGGWAAEYCVCMALSIYFVMQTMEAVIFRFFLLSVPVWLTWTWTNRSKSTDLLQSDLSMESSLPAVFDHA